MRNAAFFPKGKKIAHDFSIGKKTCFGDTAPTGAVSRTSVFFGKI
jgi:hypothetical protein